MENNLQIAFSKALKRIRVDRNMSQEDFAHTCNLDRTYISGIERQLRNPTIKTIEKILASINLSERDFLLLVTEELKNGKN